MTTPSSHDATPESLMERFRSPGFSKTLLLTIAVHAIVILGTSIPFLLSTFGAKAELTEDERIANAVSDARASLEAIAEEHGLSPQTLSKQFAPKTSPGSSSTGPAPTTSTTPAPEPSTPGSPDTPDTPEPAKSAIEKELEVTKPGPDRPEIPPVDEEDLFGTE